MKLQFDLDCTPIRLQGEPREELSFGDETGIIIGATVAMLLLLLLLPSSSFPLLVLKYRVF